MNLFLLLFWALPLLGAQELPAPGALPASAPSPAPLIVEGQSLFVFRARVGSVQPAERVRLISERIQRLSRDPLLDLEKISAREVSEIGWEIWAGDALILVITPEDARLDRHPAKFIAESIAFRLKEILTEDRRLKSPREVFIRSLYALAYLLTLILILWTMGRLSRRAQGLILSRQGTRIPSLKIKTFEVLPAERVALLLLWGLKAARVAVTATLLFFFIPLVLSLFPWTAQLSPVLLNLVLRPLHQLFQSFVGFIPNLFFIALDLLVTRYVLMGVSLFFNEIEKGSVRFSGFYPDWAKPTYQIARVLIIAFTLVVIFPYLPGSSSPAFQGISVFLGVLVSLGSSSAVANGIAGIVITYMRSFRTGDRVKIADTVGDIVEKTLLVTRVRTVKNVDVTIPNALILGSHLINYSSLAPTDGLILHTEVTLGYDVPWRTVDTLLIEAALHTTGVLTEPPPFVLQTSLENSYVSYQINVYTRQANHMATIYSELHQNIQDAFNRAQVEILSPAYSAIRDGNTVTIPPDRRAPNYRAPAFRVQREAAECEPQPGGIQRRGDLPA